MYSYVYIYKENKNFKLKNEFNLIKNLIKINKIYQAITLY